MKQLSLAKPHMLIVTGVPGSGKTRFAGSFAETFSAPYLDVGQLTTALRGDIEPDTVVYPLIKQLLRAKRTIVVEPASGSRAGRLALARLAKAQGFDPLTIWVQADAGAAKHRSTRGKNAAYSIDDYDKAVRVFTPPLPTEATCVISGMHTQASQTKVVLRRLGEISGRDRPTLQTTERAERPPRQSRRIQG